MATEMWAVAAAAVGEPGALGEVGPGHQGVDEPGDLGGIGRPVGVQHDQDVTRRGGEAARHRVPLALAGLVDHPDVGQAGTRDRNGVVHRRAVDEDHLVQVGGQRGQDVRQVPRLVPGGNDHRDSGPGAGEPHRSRHVHRLLHSVPQAYLFRAGRPAPTPDKGTCTPQGLAAFPTAFLTTDSRCVRGITGHPKASGIAVNGPYRTIHH